MKYISFIETTGANLEKDVKYAWNTFKNKGYALENAAIAPIKSLIEWNAGICYFCNFEVEKTATGCPKCHYSFLD